MKKTLFMQTTEVSASKTVGAIIGELGAYSFVREVNQKFGRGGEIAAIEFAVDDKKIGTTWYRLTPRIDEVFQVLQSRRSRPWQTKERDREQAPKVAWRQLYRWVQAQLAMIDSKMAAPQEMFFAYVLDSEGKTMFQRFLEYKALPAPEEKQR